MDYIQFCKMFYASTHIPIYLLYKEQPIYSALGEQIALNTARRWKLPPHPRGPYFSSNKPDIIYGLVPVEEEDAVVIVGPSFNLPVTDEIMDQYMRQIGVEPEQKDLITSILQAVPIIGHYRFCSILSFLHLCLNHKAIPVEQLFAQSEESFFSKSNQQLTEERTDHSAADAQATVRSENELYHFIRTGQPDHLKLCYEAFIGSMQPAALAAIPIRRVKNSFICMAVKAGELGLKPGGVDEQQISRLTAQYIQECETKQTAQDVYRLQYAMLLEYARTVMEVQIPASISNDIRRCMIYMKNRIYSQVSLSDVADHIHKSTSYIIKHFKQETGLSPGEYMMRAKLMEAKNLLQFSDMSLSAISYALCFSSQSHFQNVFKKCFGCTPMQYRKTERDDNSSPE